MNKKPKISTSRLAAFTLLFSILLPISAFSSPTGTVVISIDGVDLEKGQVLINLFNNSKGFPGEPSSALKSLSVKYDTATPQVRFEKLPHGDYAVSICHDKNSNNECDTNFLGVPQEGVGVSNNVKGFMGPPKFNDAKFKLNTDKKMLNILIRY